MTITHEPLMLTVDERYMVVLSLLTVRHAYPEDSERFTALATRIQNQDVTV